MKLIVGLGNPEKKYEETYHNIGFKFIDKLADKLEIKINRGHCKSLIGEEKIDLGKGIEKIILAKPLTYMNLSGEAVVELKNKYKIDIKDIYVICDDIDLPIGIFRYREKGSAGTHNGLRNIIQLLGDENFKRIRIGIGKDERMDLADYVLSKISQENKEKINSVIDESISFLLKI
ncbi:MAG: aminoacyl-tRNA hydrolase [Clostridia bacterium]|nr:aminoacyl-tRNA hydrolase [Clostridia bacterium]